ncbi:transporter substrate-binding domain-containing protein [Phyllobacterium chamaecytisi]|uniref:transporter substrate-binding domain-containing protein n=1 Tax=Phyllobacterium chamaecytisi TaxID=2876082 RepID=UPI001CC96F17|nr:transporter substrate-binding domain-containing protein [Phyllobacterium sp. KW56]MBZ9603256.1 transporter substrate-binding domain-containing protein [Phyllobacterium sp. KW56]
MGISSHNGKRVFLGAVLALISLTSGVAHADALANIASNGKIRVSIDPAAQPYSSVDEAGKYAGSEVEIAAKLAKDWNVQLELIPTSPANRIPYLVTNRSDIVISTLSITDERKKVIDFSKPYSAIQIVVGAPKTDIISKLEDLVGKQVAVTRGSTNDAEITKLAIPGTNIVRFEDDATSITALLSGQASYYVTAPALLTTVNKKNPSAEIEPKIVLKTNVTGIGVKKGETALQDKLNQWINTSIGDGSLNTIYKQHFGIDLPPEVTDAK